MWWRFWAEKSIVEHFSSYFVMHFLAPTSKNPNLTHSRDVNRDQHYKWNKVGFLTDWLWNEAKWLRNRVTSPVSPTSIHCRMVARRSGCHSPMRCSWSELRSQSLIMYWKMSGLNGSGHWPFIRSRAQSAPSFFTSLSLFWVIVQDSKKQAEVWSEAALSTRGRNHCDSSIKYPPKVVNITSCSIPGPKENSRCCELSLKHKSV